MRQFPVQLLAVLIFACSAIAGEAEFALVKAQLAQAPCVALDFISIVESDVFDVVDSTSGSAYLAHDGHYRIDIGSDCYIYDGTHLYSYSQENNQVTIETIDAANGLSEVSFITHLDEIYATISRVGDRAFRLEKIDTLQTDLPDRLTVYLDSSLKRLEQLDFIDINEDPNSIVIFRQQIDTACAGERFVPDFPDSTERIRLF